MKVVAIIGSSNSGKTTLIEKVVKELRRRGYRVGYVKHDPEGHGVTDEEGSDTDRIFGLTDRVVLASPDRLTLWSRTNDDPFGIIKEFFKGFDIVLLEGYKGVDGIPKVAVGSVRAGGVVLRVEAPRDASHIIELLMGMEDNI